MQHLQSCDCSRVVCYSFIYNRNGWEPVVQSNFAVVYNNKLQDYWYITSITTANIFNQYFDRFVDMNCNWILSPGASNIVVCGRQPWGAQLGSGFRNSRPEPLALLTQLQGPYVFLYSGWILFIISVKGGDDRGVRSRGFVIPPSPLHTTSLNPPTNTYKPYQSC